ncbi:endolytic transglycosylase MltG [Saccharothrix sp. ST-888]|uniref:endolytic transglycosylase MltG n=1 Tax=Saccharothrix sp. ST-888 TaxID=1427391 RepID=UPI0005EBFBAB|nr:endolytic transglycosylase MltG [Saccharothrix sp. ST-888]
MTDLGGGYQPQGAQPWHPGDPGHGGQGQQQPTVEQLRQLAGQQQTGAWQQVPQQHQQGQQHQQFAQAQYGQQGFPQQQGWQQEAPPAAGWAADPQGQQGQQFHQGQQAQQYNDQQYNGQSYGGQQFDVQQQTPQQAQQQGQFVQGGGQYDQYGYPRQQMPQQAQQPSIPQQFMPQGQPGQQAQQAPQTQQIPQQPQPVRRQQPQAPQPASPGGDGFDWEAEAAALDAPAAAEPAVEEWAEEEQHTGYSEDAEHALDEDRPSLFGSEEEPATRESERKRKEKGKKEGRRNRGACLIVAIALLGATAGAGWFGYGFYQAHFGPPPDYTGDGSGSVNVEIKSGASGEAMGQALKDADVVKSAGAFVDAVTKNPKGGTIQPGTYTLHHQMSAEAAVKELVDANGGNALTIPEGKKAVDIYAKIDAKLKLQPGTTAAVAKDKAGELGLPDYAGGNIEGFLYPMKYSVTDGMKPEDLLKQMVSTAADHYKQLGLDAGAQQAGVKDGYQVLIEASIVQAEGNNPADFGKMARVIANRLKTNVNLGMDTTLQYQLGRTKLVDKEINDKSLKYNTYVNPGLPPGPIGNPGDDAIKAALNPTPGNWAYWIAMSPTETRFAATFDEHKKNVQEYCTAHNQGFDSVRGMCK